MTWDFLKKKKKEKEKRGEYPMYLVQYPRNHTTTKVPGLGPTVELVGSMAQDSVQKKKKRKKKEEQQKK